MLSPDSPRHAPARALTVVASVLALAGVLGIGANAALAQTRERPATATPSTTETSTATVEPTAAPSTEPTATASDSPTPGPTVVTSAPAATAQRASVVLPSDEWVASMSQRVGISRPALRAYAMASMTLRDDAGCKVPWNTLAAIGYVESRHGTINDTRLKDDGTLSKPILGPRLDGGQFAAIADTDGGALDGDPQWDRAVGPLQFIPSTWVLVGRDGDGDGIADPQDINDAALSAATYLCADGHDLTSGQGWSKALFGYNHSADYVDLVRSTANAYAERSRARDQE